MKWNDVTVSQFLELQNIVKTTDEEDRIISIMELLFGEEVTDLPIPEFNKKAKELDFLGSEVPTNHIVNKVEVNGHKYTIDALVGHISTAQYIDFTNYMKDDPEKNIDKILSVFFIPKGHKYNDGYDMLEVMKDMRCLPIDIAMSESFFFSRQFKKFIQIFRSYSLKQIRKTTMSREQKKQLIHLVNSTVDLAFSHMC